VRQWHSAHRFTLTSIPLNTRMQCTIRQTVEVALFWLFLP